MTTDIPQEMLKELELLGLVSPPKVDRPEPTNNSPSWDGKGTCPF